MTVCVATLCQGGLIIGAADRMLTVEDQAIEFEPRFTKIWHLAQKRIAIMASGDAAFNAEIVDRVVVATGGPHPTHAAEPWKVREVVELYQSFFREQKHTRAGNDFLAPLGLTADEFVRRQRQLSPRLAQELTSQIIGYRMPSVGAIIAGSDNSGSHLWIVDGEKAFCCDIVGFAAIGIGAPHANSQLMLARHSPIVPAAEALLLTYVAKRRSEIAPGVGVATDMFIARPGADTAVLDADSMAHLKDYYEALIQAEKTALDAAIQNATTWLTPAPPATPQQPEPQPPSP